MTNFQTTEINLHGFRFNALVGGAADGDLVLFLHGFPEFGDAWRDVMQPIAEAGFRAVAVDQRGYSRGARPTDVSEYGIEHLLSDVRGFADALGHRRFHLVGHDWGAFLAWVFAAKHSDRLQSLSTLSTPHPDAFLNAVETDEDQKQRSRYISFFKMPDGAAESFFQADNYRHLRTVYQGKLSESAISQNIQRLAEPGALTAALNWYRALNPKYASERLRCQPFTSGAQRTLPLVKVLRGQQPNMSPGHTASRNWKVQPIGSFRKHTTECRPSC
jgi:pimeloyl-ACP methyl ester carboxylesterase